MTENALCAACAEREAEPVLCRACTARMRTHIDEIIPLSQGGTHEPANTQAAHFICNTLKSDGAAGDQLLLIG